MIPYLETDDGPIELPGRWRTICENCEWEDNFIVLYRNECEIDHCPECGSDNVRDKNEDKE